MAAGLPLCPLVAVGRAVGCPLRGQGYAAVRQRDGAGGRRNDCKRGMRRYAVGWTFVAPAPSYGQERATQADDGMPQWAANCSQGASLGVREIKGENPISTPINP